LNRKYFSQHIFVCFVVPRKKRGERGNHTARQPARSQIFFEKHFIWR